MQARALIGRSSSSSVAKAQSTIASTSHSSCSVPCLAFRSLPRTQKRSSLRVYAESTDLSQNAPISTADVESSAAAALAPPTPTSTPQQPPLRLTLETREARQTLRFSEIWDGEAPAIVVTAVASESTAADFGVVAGCRLLSLPHPTVKGDRWVLKPGSAPISRVRDLIRVYRGVLIDMEFSKETIPQEAIDAWVQEQAEKERKKEERAEEEEEGSSSSTTLTTASFSASYDSDDPRFSAEDDEARRAARALQRRLRLRAERNAIEEARDDTPLLVGATAAFLLPAAVILAIAYSTGYLDSLQAHQF